LYKDQGIGMDSSGYGTLYLSYFVTVGWLGSRVVSVLDSGAEWPLIKSQLRRCRVTVSSKLFLRVAGVIAGLAESNGSLPLGL